MNKILFISIKPEFAKKIFNGSKTIELRKSTPKVNNGDLVIIYSTTPEKAVIGICRIKSIIKTSPKQLWDQYSDKVGIDYNRYKEYYKGSKLAVGLELTSTNKLTNKISLDIIKINFPNFTPPQTYKYFDKKTIKSGFRKTLNALNC